MENIDTARKNSQLLLDILMDSMPKMPEKAPEGNSRERASSAPETVRTGGGKVDLLA
jgi:hypothetical protein